MLRKATSPEDLIILKCKEAIYTSFYTKIFLWESETNASKVENKM